MAIDAKPDGRSDGEQRHDDHADGVMAARGQVFRVAPEPGAQEPADEICDHQTEHPRHEATMAVEAKSGALALSIGSSLGDDFRAALDDADRQCS